MKTIQNYLAKAEKTLNPIDWVPYISSFSGYVRVQAGLVQIAVGLVFGVIKALLSYYPWEKRDSILQGSLISVHGALNLFRGCIALIPFLNLTLYCHDKYVGRFIYPLEKTEKGAFA